MPAPVNPNKGQLDQTQIMQRAFDETTDRLRTDAAATIIAGSLEVVISDVDDSIKIGDGSGNFVAVKGASTTPVAADKALVVSLSPNTAPVVVSGTVAVSNFPATQAISAASLPLPTGAATESTLSSLNSKVVTVDTGNVTISSALPAGSNTIGKIDQGLGGASAWKVDGSAVTQPISAASLPLPTGAATSALQTTGNSSLSSIDSKFNTLGQKTSANSAPVVLASDQSAIPITDNGGSITVDGTVAISGSVAVTGGLTDAELRATPVPISGTVTANAGTGTFAISAASLPLPTGAATSALQTTGNTSLSSIDGKIPANLTVTATRLLVDGSGVTQPISGSISVSNFPATQAVTQSTSPWVVSGTVTADAGTGTFAISAASLPLPTGAATESTLSTLNGKIPANLTVTSTRLLVDGSGVTQPVSGTVTANQGGAPWSSNTTQLAGTAIAVNAGTASAGTQRVVIASDQTSIPFETVANASVPGAVTASTSNNTAFASNPAAKGRILYNASGRNVYLKFGATASTTSFTTIIGNNTEYNFPQPLYTGRVDVITAAGSGPVYPTETTT